MIIRFYDVATGDEIGTMAVAEGELVSSGIGVSIAEGLVARSLPPEKVIEFYSDWSNGYVRSSLGPESQ